MSDQAEIPQDRNESDFHKELESLINRHCKENESNTPDFILAYYLMGCLSAFNAAVQQRETYYGRDARPSEIKLK